MTSAPKPQPAPSPPAPSPPAPSLPPPDDPARSLAVVSPDDPSLARVGMVGDAYTILLRGADTAGKYCLIDMRVPHCGGPGPHRHDFEELFILLEGEIQFTFRGEKRLVKAGQMVNVPANAPHFFTNVAGPRARMLCMCTPACQEEFFEKVGVALPPGATDAPKLDEAGMKAFLEKATALAPHYRTEILPPEPKE